MYKKIIIGLLTLPLLLTGCQSQKIESPEIVLEKMMDQELTAIKFEGKQINTATVLEDTELSLKSMNEMKGRVNYGKGGYFFESENGIKFNGDGTIEGEDFFGDAEIRYTIQLINSNMYGSLKKLDLNLNGESEDVKKIKEEFNSVQPLIQVYLNDTFKIDLDSVLELALKALKADGEIDTEKIPEFKKIKDYIANEARRDIKETGLTLVLEDMGMEEIETLSGQMVNTYHYRVGINKEAIPELIRRINNYFEFIEEEEMEESLGELVSDPEFDETIENINNILGVEIWVGQENYHIYRSKVEYTITESLSLQTQEETGGTAESKNEFIINSEPISKFELTEAENVIDLTPTLEMFINEALGI